MLILKTKITTNDANTSFYFSDVTPLYNAVSDAGGYDLTGAVNLDPADIDQTRLFLDVTLPDNTVVPFTIPNTTFNEANIGIIGLLTFEITATDLGFTTTLQDGIYKFSYKIYSEDGSQTYSAACYIAVSFEICCCLEQKLATLSTCPTCPGNSKKISDLWNAWMLQSKINHLVACHNNTGANEIFDYLNTYCDIRNCDSC